MQSFLANLYCSGNHKHSFGWFPKVSTYIFIWSNMFLPNSGENYKKIWKTNVKKFFIAIFLLISESKISMNMKILDFFWHIVNFKLFPNLSLCNFLHVHKSNFKLFFLLIVERCQRWIDFTRRFCHLLENMQK